MTIPPIKSWMCVLTAMTMSVLRDEIPEGCVEKSVAVIVRDDAIYVDVRVGLNAKDIQRYVSEWRAATADEAEGTEVETATEDAERYFTDHAAESIARSIEFTWGGERIEPEIVESRPGGQHHVTAFAQFRFARPDDEPPGDLIELTLIDRSFEPLKETVRLACKTQGSSMLKESNVAGIIVRADRLDLSTLTPTAAETARTIRALIQKGTQLFSE